MTEIESDQEMTRDEVAEYLRAFAAELDTTTLEQGQETVSHHDGERHDPRVTFMVGNDSATINPPEELSFGVAVESDGSFVGIDRDHEVPFELSWQVDEAQAEQYDERGVSHQSLSEQFRRGHANLVSNTLYPEDTDMSL